MHAPKRPSTDAPPPVMLPVLPLTAAPTRPGRAYTPSMADNETVSEVTAFLGSVAALLDGMPAATPTDPDAERAEERTLTVARARLARHRAAELRARLDSIWERHEELRREFSLRRPPDTQSSIELATGMTMAILGLGADRARHLMALVAWRRGMTLEDLARLAVSDSESSDPGAFLRGEPPADGPQPLVVRRAMAFIEQNAGSHIRTEDVATAAGIGTRGLQSAFRRHCGCTPTEYHRRIRLGGAHRELVVADPTRGDTVAAIADRWSFSNHGRFSIEYRAMYGILPSETLRH